MSLLSPPILRPDVAALVEHLIDLARLHAPRGPGREREYIEARQRISAVCGWDAEPAACDLGQYEAAMKIYAEGTEG